MLTIAGIAAIFIGCVALAVRRYRGPDRDMVRSLRGEPTEYIAPVKGCRSA